MTIIRLIDILVVFANVKKKGHPGRSSPPPGDTGKTEAHAIHLNFTWL